MGIRQGSDRCIVDTRICWRRSCYPAPSQKEQVHYICTDLCWKRHIERNKAQPIKHLAHPQIQSRRRIRSLEPSSRLFWMTGPRPCTRVYPVPNLHCKPACHSHSHSHLRATSCGLQSRTCLRRRHTQDPSEAGNLLGCRIPLLVGMYTGLPSVFLRFSFRFLFGFPQVFFSFFLGSP